MNGDIAREDWRGGCIHSAYIILNVGTDTRINSSATNLESLTIGVRRISRTTNDRTVTLWPNIYKYPSYSQKN